MPCLPVLLRSILVLSSCLCLGLHNGFPFRFPHQICVCIFAPYLPLSHPSHRLFERPNNIWLALQYMQLLIVQFPSVSFYFLPSRPMSPSASHAATHSACVIPLILESKLQTMYDIPRLFIFC